MVDVTQRSSPQWEGCCVTRKLSCIRLTFCTTQVKRQGIYLPSIQYLVKNYFYCNQDHLFEVSRVFVSRPGGPPHSLRQLRHSLRQLRPQAIKGKERGGGVSLKFSGFGSWSLFSMGGCNFLESRPYWKLM